MMEDVRWWSIFVRHYIILGTIIIIHFGWSIYSHVYDKIVYIHLSYGIWVDDRDLVKNMTSLYFRVIVFASLLVYLSFKHYSFIGQCQSCHFPSVLMTRCPQDLRESPIIVGCHQRSDILGSEKGCPQHWGTFARVWLVQIMSSNK